MMIKRPLEVNFTVMVHEKDFRRLLEEAQANGDGYEDAGPVLTIQRYLMDVGLSGAFSGEHSLGLEFILHKKKQP